MKKILYITVITLFALAGLDVNAQSVTYRVTKDDPYDIKNFSLAIDPLFVDVNGQNGYAFGWGARADYMMGKRLLLNFDVRSGFGTNGYRISNDNTKNYFYMEGAIGLVLSHRTVTRNAPIILSKSSYSSGGYTYTSTLSIKGGVPARNRKLFALRAGVYQMNNSLNYKNLYDSLMTFKGAGKEFTYRDSANASIAKNKIDQWGALSSTAIFGGFNFRTIRQLEVDVDGWGYRENKAYSDFFIDGIFAPILLIRDYKTENGDKFNVKYTKANHFGWRAGWVMRKPKDQGFSFKFEFGQRPGLKAIDNKQVVNFKNWYCMFTYGLYIPLKVKPVYTE